MKKAGFTLAELSVVLIIIALVIGMTVSGGVTVISAARYSATISKMNALDQALMSFRTANDRLPCPSDLSQTQGSATYGTEGNCTAIAGGVFVAQNASATATAAEGGIPTVALGLPSDFMYDGWGNRFRYAVDTRMTAINAFSLMQAGCVNGAITVYGGPSYPATGNTARTTGAIYALISHGANGHGGYTKNAVVTDAGSLNQDEQTNCHCTSTGAAGTYAPTYVQLAPYTYQAIGQANSNYNFDDIVSYKERWQMQTTWDKVGTNCAGGAFSRAITINSSYVSTVNHTNLTNFPMLFSGTYSYLATTANGGNVNNANGYDITFTSDAAGNDLLPFERESYNASTGAVVFWVQVPSVSASANTTIYLWYGNPDITTDQSNKTGTWDSNYMGVWHLSQNPGGTAPQITDSTSKANNGTSNGSMTSANQVTGQIGNAVKFNSASSQYVNMGSPGNGSLDFGTGDFTLEAWFTVPSAPGAWTAIYDKGGSGTVGYGMEISNTNNITCSINGTSGTNQHVYATTTVSGNIWYHAVCAFPRSDKIYLYINGSQNTSAAYSSGNTNSVTDSSAYFTIGGRGSGWSNNGTIDEVRVSSYARSADWIITEYNNESSPGTFYTVGSAVSR